MDFFLSISEFAVDPHKGGKIAGIFQSYVLQENVGYSAINTARSAIASFTLLDDCSYTVGTHPLICTYL